MPMLVKKLMQCFLHLHCRFLFGRVEPNWIVLTNDTRDYGVLFLEQDQFIPGNILFIDDHAIKTLNLETAETWLIAGDVTTP